MRSSDGGFTLFEVLGAVAMLAIFYTTLSTVAIRGLRSEGDSQRMLEASMVADWELSEFELELEKGAAPEIGITEGDEEDGFVVTWEVKPLQTAIFEGPSAQKQGAQTPNPADQVGVTSGGSAAFLQVDLRISWFEAGNERWVTRTAFAVDEDAAARLAAESVLDESIPEGEQP
jgi:hypothetical protein